MIISVIIPIFNEKEVIQNCLLSLRDQSLKGLPENTEIELIVVDDGSNDGSYDIAKEYADLIIKQDHLGTAIARNKGAEVAKGEILVFVDGDMTFDKEFINKLITPIAEGRTIGTFSKEEFLSNKNNPWATFWNINRGLPKDRMHPDNYPDHQAVFRAILKKEFNKVNGFNSTGYADDWTLAKKLGVEATLSKGAIFYHKNPDNLGEIFTQARWFGKNEFITGNLSRKLYNLLRYSLPVSLIKGVITSIKFCEPRFIIFKIDFDFAVTLSIIGSFFNENKYK